ncbi:MAG TPA: membrane protein FxsA [Colwellia sp.]|nr:membrane protein FxsA [Colwellia sp.]|tara:strand:+ start:713 stop:1231 length:519 start_codon:yes stop_codon:yes gene_type:complete
MFQLLFVLFIIIPIIEITVIMQVGALLGVWPTIAIVILSAWLGAKYVRQQGLVTLQSVQKKMAQGEMPSGEIVTGLMLLVAGVFLVTPGFVTDIFGLLLLLPSVRVAIAAQVQQHLKVNPLGAGASFHHGSAGNVYQHENSNEPFTSSSTSTNEPISHHQGDTLEGEFKRKD